MKPAPPTSDRGSRVFLLIHGTWSSAKRALWIQEESALVRAIRERFGRGSGIGRPEWTGLFGTRRNNSHRCRLAGGRKVAEEIRQIVHDDPEARIVLVGYSHGGNVALYAFRELEGEKARAAVAGIVCLATPFIRARERRGAKPLHFFNALLSVATGLLLFAALLSGFLVALSLVATAFAYPLAAIPLLLVGFGLFRAGGASIQWIEVGALGWGDTLLAFGRRLAEEATSTYDVKRSADLPIFVATAPGDEALVGLASLVRLTGVAEAGWRAGVYSLLFVGLFGYFALTEAPSGHPLLLTLASVSSFAVLHVLLSPLLSRVRALGLGWHSLSMDLVGDVHVARTPAGLDTEPGDRLDRDAVVRSYPSGLGWTRLLRGQLRHSRVYDLAVAIDDIFTWMAAVLDPLTDLQIERRRRLARAAFQQLLEESLATGRPLNIVRSARALHEEPPFEPLADWLGSCTATATQLAAALARQLDGARAEQQSIPTKIARTKDSLPRLIKIQIPGHPPDFAEEPPSVRNERIRAELQRLKGRETELAAETRSLERRAKRLERWLPLLHRATEEARGGESEGGPTSRKIPSPQTD